MVLFRRWEKAGAGLCVGGCLILLMNVIRNHERECGAAYWVDMFF